MMYRKKTEIIEAFRMTLEALSQTPQWPDWLKAARVKKSHEVGAIFVANDTGGGSQPIAMFYLRTTSGLMAVREGNWIIRFADGELIKMTDDNFWGRYEEHEVPVAELSTP